LASLTFILRDEKWSAVLVNEQLRPVADGPEAMAFCDYSARQLVFNQEYFDMKVVIHELYHAYCRYLYLDSSNTNKEDLEEILAEFWSETLLKFTNLARAIHTGLKTKKATPT
jgi:hypothetical protein